MSHAKCWGGALKELSGWLQGDMRQTLKDSYSTPFPITFLAYFCHNGWKTYLKSQFPVQLGWPHDTGRGSKEGYASLKPRQGMPQKKVLPLWSSPFFLPGTQIRCLEVQRPKCDCEPSWRMKAAVLRTVTQRDSRSQEAAAAALSWPHLDSCEMRKIRP